MYEDYQNPYNYMFNTMMGGGFGIDFRQNPYANSFGRDYAPGQKAPEWPSLNSYYKENQQNMNPSSYYPMIQTPTYEKPNPQYTSQVGAPMPNWIPPPVEGGSANDPIMQLMKLFQMMYGGQGAASPPNPGGVK